MLPIISQRRASAPHPCVGGGTAPLQHLAPKATPRGPVALEPGGYHLMLFGVEQGLQVDDSVRVELQLASGEAVVAHLRARPMRGKKKQ